MTEIEQLWINHMVKMGRTVVILDRSGGTAIYKSWRDVETGSSRIFTVDVYYHVWDGKEHYVFPNVQEAQKLYEKRANERR